jgi:hypothetical protein
MQDNVLAIGRIHRASFRNIPRENHRSHSAACLALPMHRSFLPHRAFNVAFLFHEIYRRIDKNREKGRKVIGLAMQQKNAGLSRDRDNDFIGDFEPATTFEAFFTEKHLNVAQQFGLIPGRKPMEKRNVAFDYLSPIFRKRLSPQPTPSPLLQ